MIDKLDIESFSTPKIGKWITHYKFMDIFGECSACSGVQNISANLPFCPWCGIKMDVKLDQVLFSFNDIKDLYYN